MAPCLIRDPDFRPVLVRVNGSKQYLRFVLDTGSGMSVLSKDRPKARIKPVARGGMARAVGSGVDRNCLWLPLA